MRNLHVPAFALLLVASALSGGCATIVGGGGKEAVVVRSAQSGDHVEVINKKGKVVHNGVTPLTVTLKRGAGYFSPARYTVRVTDSAVVAGTQASAQTINRASSNAPRQATLKAGLNGWYFGNILFGGLIGMLGVDPATGAMWNLPDDFNVDTTGQPKAHQKGH